MDLLEILAAGSGGGLGSIGASCGGVRGKEELGLSPRTDPRIRRHLEAERQRTASAALRDSEAEARRAHARGQAERLARLRQSDAETRSFAAAVPAVVTALVDAQALPDRWNRRPARQRSSPQALPGSIVSGPHPPTGGWCAFPQASQLCS